ncbi:MAG: hypothetical protein C4347_01665 [Patescibacteria group bacterium]
MANKYASKFKQKVEKVMREFKQGKLRDVHGRVVNNVKQALAIALSEARELVKRAKTRKKSK